MDRRVCVRTVATALLLGLCLLLSQAQRLDAQEPKAIFEHGQRALSDGQYSVAEQDFDQLLHMGVRSASTYTNLGVVYMRTNRLDAAVKALERAKHLAPGMIGIDLDLGLAYFKLREFKKAAPFFARVISADPSNVQAHYLKGVSAFMIDDFAAAVEALAPILDRERDDLEYLFMLGISYGMLKQTEDSRNIFERLVEAGGDTPHLHLLLGKAYLALGQDEKAEAEFERSIANQPLPFAHYYLGVLNQKLGKNDIATIQFEKEIEVAPNNPWPYKDLSNLKMEQGNLSDAITLLEKGNSCNPDTPDLLAALGRAYLQASKPDRAIRVLHRAIALDSKDSAYHYQLARAYLAVGRRQEAATELAKARSLVDSTSEGQMGVFSRDHRIEPQPAKQ